MALQSSQRLPETAFYMKKSKGFFKFYILHSTWVPIQNSKSRTPEEKELFDPESNSTHRRQRDLRVHPFILQDLPKAFPDIPDIPDIPVIRDIQPPQAILHVPVPPGFSPHYSILQLECIFYTSAGFHRNSTEYQLRHYKLQTFILLQRKGDVVISVKTYQSDVKMTFTSK